jgi:hypothetical protein
MSTCLGYSGILMVTLNLKLITSHFQIQTILVRVGCMDTKVVLVHLIITQLLQMAHLLLYLTQSLISTRLQVTWLAFNSMNIHLIMKHRRKTGLNIYFCHFSWRSYKTQLWLQHNNRRFNKIYSTQSRVNAYYLKVTTLQLLGLLAHIQVTNRLNPYKQFIIVLIHKPAAVWHLTQT